MAWATDLCRSTGLPAWYSPPEIYRLIPDGSLRRGLVLRDNNIMPLQGVGEGERAVLIVEDSENSATTLEIAFFGIPDLSVLLASSAVEAVRILNGAADVRVIVTDLNMPRMDGFELIRRVRGDQRRSETPIIVVSADTDPTVPSRIAELGVNAFFAKPFSPAEVRRKLEQLLNGTTTTP
jgi:two-component system, chemotaxis family, chemotaxis protein CheY